MNPPIATDALKGYKEPQWYAEDRFIETPDKKYALYFYNIEELTMMAYYACLSIFAENKFDSPLLSSDKIRVSYNNATAFSYAHKSGCFIFKMPARNTVKPDLDFPYLLIKPQTGQFSFIDGDVTSLYYSLKELSENVLQVEEESPKELERFNSLRRTGEIIDLNELKWYDLAYFDNAGKIYSDRQK